MKQILAPLLLLTSICGMAQHILPESAHKKKKEKNNYDLFREESIIPHPHEIKFDVLGYFVNKKVQVSYEYQKNLQWYVGTSIALHNNSDRKNSFSYDKYFNLPKYEVVPYVRYALTDDQIKFVFLEGFVSFNGGKHKDLEQIQDNGSVYYQIKNDTYFDIALGAAIGFKTIIKKRIILDLYGGTGFNMISDKSPRNVMRYGINLGYCF